jgi:hypothetical protein
VKSGILFSTEYIAGFATAWKEVADMSTGINVIIDNIDPCLLLD